MAEVEVERLSTGVPGLDEVLFGGLIPGLTYVVTGGPGAGKTTLAMHFAMAAEQAREKALYVTLKDPERQVRRNARALGLNLDGVTFLDLSPAPEMVAREEPYQVFAPADVEKMPLVHAIRAALEADQPRRVIIDSINILRYLSAEPYQFRQLAISLMRLVTRTGATLLAPVEATAEQPESELQFIAEAVIELQQTPIGRKVRVIKFAGSGYLPGEHSLALTGSGMLVFPRLVPSTHRRQYTYTAVPSGIRELDEMLHGGLERGTFTVISGPTGAGKTTFGLQFMKEAARRGDRSVVYSFEENPEAIRTRAEGIAIPIGDMLAHGTLSLVRIEALQYSPDEFVYQVRQEVEQRDARVIMIDGLEGYKLSIRMHGGDVVGHLHALAEYLNNMGVAGILTADVSAITGSFHITEESISYLADDIIFLRWLEMGGALHRVVGVLKKRLTGHERTLREFDITPEGLKLGLPIEGAYGILTGVATPIGAGAEPVRVEAAR